MGTNPTARRLQPSASARPPSPNLIRSERSSNSFAVKALTTDRFMARSKSTTRVSSKPTSSENNRMNPDEKTTTTIIKPSRKSFSTSRDTGNRDALLARYDGGGGGGGSPRNYSGMRRVKSATTSPSAWALSPGRMMVKTTSSRGSMTPPESPVRGRGSGVASGVLKYLRNHEKKVSPIEEEGYHRFRVLHNRLIQWRFVNAKAEATMRNLKTRTEDRLFSVWFRIYKLRNHAAEKLIQSRKLRLETKLNHILRLQVPLLNQWAKMDAKNHEALSRVTRKLHALSIRVPLTHGAKTDINNIVSMYEAMTEAIEVMDGIEEALSKYFLQVEKVLYLLTELASMSEQIAECSEEVEKTISLVPALLARESSLRVHLVQAEKEAGKLGFDF